MCEGKSGHCLLVLVLLQGSLFLNEWPDRLWALTLNFYLSFWLGRDLVTRSPWLPLCLELIPSPRCYLAAVGHLSQGRMEKDTLE